MSPNYNKMRKAAILFCCIGFCTIYLAGISTNYDSNNRLTSPDKKMELLIKSSAVHDPIFINSDSLFDSAHGVTSGDGTPGNPYIIEDWEIDGSHGQYGIRIENTQSYVTIQNCEINNSASGIWLWYADNVVITNCIINNLEGDDGDDATASAYAEAGETVYGIYSYAGDNINITNNKIFDLLGGKGGEGYPDTLYDYGYDGGSAYGIYLSGFGNLRGNIQSNHIFNLKSGNGGAAEVSIENTAGSSGGDAGNVYGIYSTMSGSCSRNVIYKLYSGDGGRGGDAGDTPGGGGDGKLGGRGGNVGLIIGIQIYNVNIYHYDLLRHDIYFKIQENTVSELFGGVGGFGGHGGDTIDPWIGGDGGSGGFGGFVYPYSVDYSQCLNVSSNIAFNIKGGLYGLGGDGGISLSWGNSGEDGNPAQISAYKFNHLVDAIITNNTVFDLFHHPHDHIGYKFGLELLYGSNIQILGNNFETGEHFIYESSRITLNTLQYGNYWGIFPGALDSSPEDGYMDIPYVIPSDNITDYRPLAYPTYSDTDGDSISLLDELLLGRNPCINELTAGNSANTIGEFMQDYGTVIGMGSLGLIVIAMGFIKRK
jgi:hypothetical protein